MVLSRLDTGSLTLVRESVILVELFEEVCKLFKRLAERRGINLEIGQARGAAWRDADRLRQVLLILLGTYLGADAKNGVMSTRTIASLGDQVGGRVFQEIINITDPDHAAPAVSILVKVGFVSP